MASVTADVPGVSLRRFSGSVASSAISTYRSRSMADDHAGQLGLGAPASARTRPRNACASSTAP